jgi:sucrose-6-phosphate hydrolase SacC (GH32 family)
MFVDVSVIEVFLNYKKILTSRIYPNLDSKNFEIYSEGGNAEIDIQLWTMDNYK